MSATATIDLEQYMKVFQAHGGTDEPYLRHHFRRFADTKQRFLSHWNRDRGNRLLDVGAHWLHQSLLYAIDGFAVTAVDLPITFELANVRSLAQAEGRQLQALIDEALADLIEKRKQGKPRTNVMAAYQASHEKFGPLYKKLAE